METGRLRVHDPFELIRWLALSQPDPRFEAPLEQLVEVAAYADRRLAASRGRRGRGEPRPRDGVTRAPVPKV